MWRIVRCVRRARGVVQCSRLQLRLPTKEKTY